MSLLSGIVAGRGEGQVYVLDRLLMAPQFRVAAAETLMNEGADGGAGRCSTASSAACHMASTS
jgi:hypothetical protein